MIEQVTERKYVQFLFKQVGPQGSYPFEVFDRTG